MTLLVFPSDGLAWPAVMSHPFGAANGFLRTSRGFHALLWRRGDLGYALVSDVDVADIDALASKIEGR